MSNIPVWRKLPAVELDDRSHEHEVTTWFGELPTDDMRIDAAFLLSKCGLRRIRPWLSALVKKVVVDVPDPARPSRQIVVPMVQAAQDVMEYAVEQKFFPVASNTYKNGIKVDGPFWVSREMSDGIYYGRMEDIDGLQCLMSALVDQDYAIAHIHEYPDIDEPNLTY